MPLELSMANCFMCGSAIQKGSEIRSHVYTGASVQGFNVSSNILINWALNSLLSRKRASVRSFYSVKTLCPSCDASYSASQRRKFFVAVSVGAGIVALVIIFFAISR